MESAFPRDIYSSAHDGGPKLLTFQGIYHFYHQICVRSTLRVIYQLIQQRRVEWKLLMDVTVHQIRCHIACSPIVRAPWGHAEGSAFTERVRWPVSSLLN